MDCEVAVFAKGEKVWKATGVIGMFVSDEEFVDVVNIFAESLKAEIGSAIDEDVVGVREAKECGRASTVVVGICGCTNVAFTSDCWDTAACA